MPQLTWKKNQVKAAKQFSARVRHTKMRIWSIHPKYLDTKGLLAVWREGLLAQKVLMNETKGYKNHPQLLRFKSEINSVAAIGAYLEQIYKEAQKRGYKFNFDKIENTDFYNKLIVTNGQVDFEWKHFKSKVRKRNPIIYRKIKNIRTPKINPIFIKKNGIKEKWEKDG